MKTIRTTTVREQDGVQVNNDRIMVMTSEDFKHIQKIFESGSEVNKSFSEQFDALEKVIYLQKEMIEHLERRILALESRNRVYR
jgi:hypothetical protein